MKDFVTRCVTVTGVLSLMLVSLFQTSGSAQFVFGPGPDQPELELVARFDKDSDGRLNREERNAARASIAARLTRPSFPPFGTSGRSGAPGRRLAPADVRTFPTTPFYDLQTLRTIFLDFESNDWEDELGAFYNTDVEVPATMTVDGRTYRDVGIHFRGMSSFFGVPAGLKRSLNVSIDFVHRNQDVDGYQTLNLLNANGDPTFLRAVLYSEIARRYVPTPKTNFVRLVINGESWGVYVNSQQFNGDFVREWFKTSRGSRWKAPGSPRGGAGLEYLGDDMAPYRQRYEIKTKDDPESWAALIRLCRVLNETPLDKLEAALAPLLDIDGALKFLAVEAALVNSDGYWARASDFNLYREPDGRFHIVPHDVNEAFGEQGGRGGGPRRGGFPPVGLPDGPRGGLPPSGFPNGPRRGGFPPGGPGFFGSGGPELDPLVSIDDPTKPLRSRLLAVPALRERYLGYVQEIATKWLDWSALAPIVESAHGLIAEDVKADTRKLYDDAGFEAGVAATGNPLKTFVERRRAYLLAYTPPSGVRLRAAAR